MANEGPIKETVLDVALNALDMWEKDNQIKIEAINTVVEKNIHPSDMTFTATTGENTVKNFTTSPSDGVIHDIVQKGLANVKKNNKKMNYQESKDLVNAINDKDINKIKEINNIHELFEPSDMQILENKMSENNDMLKIGMEYREIGVQHFNKANDKIKELRQYIVDLKSTGLTEEDRNDNLMKYLEKQKDLYKETDPLSKLIKDILNDLEMSAAKKIIDDTQLISDESINKLEKFFNESLPKGYKVKLARNELNPDSIDLDMRSTGAFHIDRSRLQERGSMLKSVMDELKIVNKLLEEGNNFLSDKEFKTTFINKYNNRTAEEKIPRTQSALAVLTSFKRQIKKKDNNADAIKSEKIKNNNTFDPVSYVFDKSVGDAYSDKKKSSAMSLLNPWMKDANKTDKKSEYGERTSLIKELQEKIDTIKTAENLSDEQRCEYMYAALLTTEKEIKKNPNYVVSSLLSVCQDKRKLIEKFYSEKLRDEKQIDFKALKENVSKNYVAIDSQIAGLKNKISDSKLSNPPKKS